MNIEATTHIIKRCIQLLKIKNGTTKVKNEYYY